MDPIGQSEDNLLLLMLLLLFFVPAPVGGHRSTPKEKRDGRKETLAKGERHTQTDTETQADRKHRGGDRGEGTQTDKLVS